MTSFLSAINKKKNKTSEQLVISVSNLLSEIIANTRIEQIGGTDQPSIDTTKLDELAALIQDIKLVLYGDLEHPTINETKCNEISQYLQSINFLLSSIEHLEILPLECRKDIALIFNNLLHKNYSNFHSYLQNHLNTIIPKLINAYSNNDIALNCGAILKECIKINIVCEFILINNKNLIWLFFTKFVQLPNFDIASDAFNLLKDILTLPQNKDIINRFLNENKVEFVQYYQLLLQSENYVTRRRSLKMLAELLLDRSNYNLMMTYISSKDNLKTIMNLLRHKSTHIQFETFHVFKIFVANPKKTFEVASILFNNRDKLILYLQNFHSEKNNDLQFVEEKKLLIETLQNMEEPIQTMTTTQLTAAEELAIAQAAKAVTSSHHVTTTLSPSKQSMIVGTSFNYSDVNNQTDSPSQPSQSDSLEENLQQMKLSPSK